MAKKNALAMICLSLLLIACAKDGSPAPQPPQGPSPPVAPVNRAPSAVAGTDASGVVGATITVSAAGSTDPDGDALTYAWAVISGPGGATLGNATSASATFTATQAGTYVLEVTVRDATATATDQVTLTFAKAPSTTAITLKNVPARVLQGDPVNLIVQLPAPAGAGGTTVTLAATGSPVFDLPASVLVAEGQTMAVVPMEAVAQGDARLTASAAGLDTAVLDTAADASVFTLALSTAGAGIPVGTTSTVTVVLLAPAPAGGARVNLALSGGASATLASSQLDIAAGTTSVSTLLTATKIGTLNITATTNDGHSPRRVRVSVLRAGISVARTSTSLIQEAVEAGTLNAETAAVYRVLAAVGAPELPIAFRGNNVGQVDAPGTRDATALFTTMSTANQALVAKYLFPPIYRGSWGDDSAAPVSKQSSRTRAQALNVSCFQNLNGMPTTEELPHWHVIPLRSFKIWYPEEVDPNSESFNYFTAEDIPVAALNIAATIQETYDKLVRVFGREPMNDENVTCNGGDRRIDVYLARYDSGIKAQVRPHLPGACARPGWIIAAPNAFLDSRGVRNILAHELVHLFQLDYDRPNCTDPRYNVVDEATAAWAWDHVYPTDNYEHTYLDAFYFGNSPDWDAPLVYWNPARAYGDNNGYDDYAFFEWLDRKYGPQTMVSVLDATATVNAQRAFEVGLQGFGGGLKELWPKFVMAMYNDSDNHVFDEFFQWEHKRDASIRVRYIQGEEMFVDAKLGGAQKADLHNELFVKFFPEPRHYTMGPMTMRFVSIKFTDPTVAQVQFRHGLDQIGSLSPRWRALALQKIDGRWLPLEDWTHRSEISYCREKKAERIQELVLIMSNSDAGDDYIGPTDTATVRMNDYSSARVGDEHWLNISNVACMPWSGTSSVVVTDPHGGRLTSSAFVEWEPLDPPDPNEPLPPLQFFIPKSGTAHVDGDLIDDIGCHYITRGVDGPIDNSLATGRLTINTDTRVGAGGGITTIPGSEHTFSCAGAPPISSPGPANSNWLKLPATGWLLEPDGRTLRGSTQELDPISGTTTTSTWNFTSAPEE